MLREKKVRTAVDFQLHELPGPGKAVICLGGLSAGFEYPGAAAAVLTEGRAVPTRKVRTKKDSSRQKLASYADRWSPENPASNIPRVNAVGREEYSSRVIEDGSFLRLKNVSLGYTLPSRSLRKAGISQMRVYVSADNIWTLTGYSGPDPEVSTRNSVLTPGFDWSAYPRAFGFTAGVNLTF